MAAWTKLHTDDPPYIRRQRTSGSPGARNFCTFVLRYLRKVAHNFVGVPRTTLSLRDRFPPYTHSTEKKGCGIFAASGGIRPNGRSAVGQLMQSVERSRLLERDVTLSSAAAGGCQHFTKARLHHVVNHVFRVYCRGPLFYMTNTVCHRRCSTVRVGRGFLTYMTPSTVKCVRGIGKPTENDSTYAQNASTLHSHVFGVRKLLFETSFSNL